MPSLVKGRWKARVKLSKSLQRLTGKREITKLYPSGQDKHYREAILFEEATKKELLRMEAVGAIQDVTLAEWNDAYLDYVERGIKTKEFAKKTYDRKLYAFRHFVDAFGHATQVNDIKPSGVLEYMLTQEELRSGVAANKDKESLSAGWKWARSGGVKNWPIDEAHPNPFRAIESRPEEESDRYVPPVEDFWAVYDSTEGQDKVILTAAYYLAARRGELWDLEWKRDIDLANRRVRLLTFKVKGKKPKVVWLPMVDELYQALLWQWEKVRPLVKAHDHVFWSQADNQHYGNPFVCRQTWMKKICKKTDVKYFGMHAIRHRRAIDLYISDAPLGAIQKWLRHDASSTTEIYLKKFGLDFDNLLEVAEKATKGEVVNFDKR